MTPVPLVLAVACTAGGVARTTTAAAVAGAWAAAGHRTLAIDLDPGGALAFALGVDPRQTPSVADWLDGRADAGAAAVAGEGCGVLCGTADLLRVEHRVAAGADPLAVVAPALRTADAVWDRVVVDCPAVPSPVAVAALAVADTVVVPLRADVLGHRAAAATLDMAEDLRLLHGAGPRERVVVPVAVARPDQPGAMLTAIVEDLRARYPVDVLAPVPRSRHAAEAPAAGRSVVAHAPASAVAAAYRAVAAALAAERSTGTDPVSGRPVA